MFTKTFDNGNEVNQVRSLCKNTFWGFSAQFIPMRTHNWRDLAQDLFVPAFMDIVLRIDSIASVIIPGIFLLVVDLVTLPF